MQDLEKMSSADLKQLQVRIQETLNKQAAKKQKESVFTPGSKFEVAGDGSLTLVESSQSTKLRESRVRSYMALGLPKDAAEKAADKDTQEAA